MINTNINEINRNRTRLIINKVRKKGSYTKSGYASRCMRCADIFRKEKGYSNNYNGYTKDIKNMLEKITLRTKKK